MMKFYLVLLVFSFSILTVSAQDIIEPDLAMSNAWKYIDGIRFEAPKKVSDKEFKKRDVYHIRTRVVIETARIKWPGTKDAVNVRGASHKRIEDSLLMAEKVYKDVGLAFHVSQYVFMEYQEDISKFWLDASANYDSMSIYFLLPRSGMPFHGISSAPWELSSSGIMIFSTAGKRTIAHEIGHYFGLLHPFQPTKKGDHIKDTPESSEQRGGPNENNIMMYTDFSFDKFPFLTKGQVERAQLFLRAKRQRNVFDKPPVRTMTLEDLFKGYVIEISNVPSK